MEEAMRAELRFHPSVDAIPDYVDEVMAHVGGAYDGTGARVALGEALLNAVVHGVLRPDEAKTRVDPVRIADQIADAEATVGSDRNVVVEIDTSASGSPTLFVRDPGPGFDWLSAALRAGRPPEPAARGGRGLHLVRMGVACVDWNDTGNEVRLRLRRSDAPRQLGAMGFVSAPTLPSMPAPKPAAQHVVTPIPAASRVHRILIVDDDPVARRIVQRALAASGFAIELASSGVAALERFAEATPDAVVLDLEMPGLSGIDVLDRLGDSGLLLQCPVILLTATEPTAETRARALEAGAATFMVKPITSRELVAQLRSTLNTQERIAVLGAERDGLRAHESRIASVLSAVSPPRAVVRPYAKFESRVVQAASLGGDLFDLVDAREGVTAAILTDVAGKGGPAAITAAAIRYLARDRLKSSGAIIPTFAALNEQLYDDFEATRQHAAVSAVIVDAEAGVVHVANAGNPPVVVVPFKGEPILVKSATPMLGLARYPRFKVETFLLSETAHVIAPSDGLVECFARPSDSIAALEAVAGGKLHAGMRCPDVERAVSWATTRDDASLLFISFPEEAAS
jgi:CheY-like chemotaxis protein